MCCKLSIHLLLYLLLCIGLSSNKCPVWHISRNGQCECSNSFNKIIQCGDNVLFVERGYCLTWNNSAQSAELHRCFFSQWSSNNSLPCAWTGQVITWIEYVEYHSILLEVHSTAYRVVSITGEGHNVDNALMAMDLHSSLMISFALTILSANTFGH